VFVDEVYRLELRDPVEFLEGETLGDDGAMLVFLQTGRVASERIPKARVVSRRRLRLARAVGFQTLSQWHLEGSDVEAGYAGRTCELDGGDKVLGKIGGAVLLNHGDPRGRDRLLAQPAPEDLTDPYQLPRGGRFALWVYALPPGTSGFLLRRARSYHLRVTPEGTLEGGAGGDLIETERYVLPLERWVHVVFLFAPGHMQIVVDGVPRASGDCPPLGPPEYVELVFGKNFSGVLDEIHVQRRVESEALEIPDGYELRGPPVVIFDERGRLDPKEHTGSVRLTLAREGEKAGRGFSISRNGLIE
jgi:hypothetical protein